MLNLKSFEDFLYESIWSDMQDRGNGDTVKNEDDIDLLDEEEFWTYLTNKYKSNSSCGVYQRTSTYSNDRLLVILEKWKDNGIRYSYELGFDYCGISWRDGNHLIDKENLRIYNCFEPHVGPYKTKDYEEDDSFFKEYVDFPSILGDAYIVDKNGITPKSGKLENHHIIDILDKCLSVVKKPYVKKIKNPRKQ